MLLIFALCLEEHTDDRHHREAAVCQLGIELLRLLSRILGGQHLEAEVTGVGRCAGLLGLGDLAVGHVQDDLTPTSLRHLGDSSQAIWDVSELQASGWAQVTGELSGDFRCDVSHGCKHGNSSVLKFGGTTALEVLHAAICRQSCWIPESHGGLHSKLVLERSQRRGGVVSPVAPGTAGEAILCTRQSYDMLHRNSKHQNANYKYLMQKNYV